MNMDIRTTEAEDWMLDPRRKCAGRPDENTEPARRAFGIRVDTRWMPDGAENEERAKKNCDGCQFKAPCLQSALDNDEEYGIWGGTTGAERAQLKGGGADAA